MRPLLSSTQMKDLDNRAIKDFGLPSRLLMETAGKACAEIIANHYPKQLAGPVCVFCGSGNNGGDGFVIARWLANWGCEVNIIRVGKGSSSPETTDNLELCRKLGIPIIEVSSSKNLSLAQSFLENSSLVVDAIFGIGFKEDLKPWLDELFELINSYSPLTISVDIPSGLNADTGFGLNPIYAEGTITMDSMKIGHVTGIGREACGEIHVVDIGIPSYMHENLETVLLFEEEDFRPPLRLANRHKNDYGRVFVFGGIPGFTGAAAMAAHAALRAGCGYAYVVHRKELAAVYALKLTEAMSRTIPESPKTGRPDTKALLRLVEGASAVLIGPGLGQDDFALQLLKIMLRDLKAPLVVDADAITLISENPALYKYLSKPNVLLTPHWGEFARLAKIGKDEILQDCLGVLRAFVKERSARVLLKSHYSVYHDSDQTLVNISGNDGLATVGSGDVLAGIICSFLAQNESIPSAAIKASFLLGKTAETLAKTRCTPSILPTDIIASLFLKHNEII